MTSDVESDSAKMPGMIFVAGAIAGGILGLVAGAMLQRRAGGSSVLAQGGLTTAMAVLALVVAAVALADSGRDGDRDAESGAAASATTTTAAARATVTAEPATTTTTVATGLVTVPNVSRPPLTQKDAEDALKGANLQVNVETLALTNVPPGFVISQSPLPEARATAGSTVTLVVSAAA